MFKEQEYTLGYFTQGNPLVLTDRGLHYKLYPFDKLISDNGLLTTSLCHRFSVWLINKSIHKPLEDICWGINLTFVILNSFLKLRLTVEILRTDPNSRIIHISCSLLKGLLTRRLCTFDISFLIFSNVHMWETFRGFQKN